MKQINSLKKGRLHYHGLPAEFQEPCDSAKWKAAIAASAAQPPSTVSSLSIVEFYEECRSLARRYVSPQVQEIVSQFGSKGGFDAVVIPGLPHEHPGPGPRNGERPLGKSKLSEMVLIGMAEAFGKTVFGYLQEKEGRLVHEIAPIEGREREQSSGSRNLLGWHTDGGCFGPRYQPEFLLLLGLINNSVGTLFLTLPEILAHTDPWLIGELRRSIYTFFSPKSFVFGRNARCISDRRPVIYRDERGVDRITLPARDMHQFNPEAEELLQRFHDHLDTLTPHDIVIREGMMVAWRNTRVIHARGPIGNSDERWLQRVYCSSDIHKYRQATGAPVPAFAFDARLLFTHDSIEMEQPVAAPTFFIPEVTHESVRVQ